MPQRRSPSRLSRPLHGGVESNQASALAMPGQAILDFSANINPLGPSPRVREAMTEFDPSRYPDLTNRKLKTILAEMNGVSPDQVAPGNGSSELIHLLAEAFVEKGDRVLIFAPTFGDYEFACRLNGARVSFITSREKDNFQWDISSAVKKLQRLRPVLVFLCNPNSPTGIYLSLEEVGLLMRSTADGLFVMDEAFITFTDNRWDSTRLLRHRNFVIMRSLTKDYALAGLRLGYTLSSRRVAQLIRTHQPTWSVSAAAQVAGLAALSDPAHLEKARGCVREARGYLERALDRLGFKVFPSEANFLLVKVGNGAEFQAKLLSRLIYVRDCTSFGLPEFVRIGVRTLPECQRLVSAVDEVLGTSST
ncbi:MAG: histidinol-phosphate aminotransferase family protein [Chloroflexi bacterium]|nr:histidinol-phosphate aminotransferase family protein [Chloroflexota bacterium]